MSVRQGIDERRIWLTTIKGEKFAFLPEDVPTIVVLCVGNREMLAELLAHVRGRVWQCRFVLLLVSTHTIDSAGSTDCIHCRHCFVKENKTSGTAN